MATKNVTKIKSMFAELFRREEHKDTKTLLSESRERERHLMSKLERMLATIDAKVDIRLPDDKIKEYRIEGRIARMRKILEEPLITNVDTTALHQQIMSFADSLDLALQKGYDRMAYWASMALHKAVETLWIQTPDLYVQDPEMEMALYVNKLHYAHNLSNIIALAKQQDTLAAERDVLEPDHKRRNDELLARRNAYLAMSKTEAGRKLVASAEAKSSDPTSLNEAEKAYVENKERIDKLTDLIKISLTQLESIDTELITTVKSIESTRMQLLHEPDVEDPKLVAKIKQANKIFRERITRQLDRAYEEMRTFEEHVDEMEALQNHVAIKHRYAKIQETVDRLETEELNRSLAELEARREVIRKAQNSVMLSQQVQEIQKQTEEEVLVDIEPPEVEVDEEPEMETEVEYEL